MPSPMAPSESGRPSGLSVRVKLALSYAGFLIVAGIALFVVGFLLLRFVPEGNVQVVGGGFAPNRTNLIEVFVRYADAVAGSKLQASWFEKGLGVVGTARNANTVAKLVQLTA